MPAQFVAGVMEECGQVRVKSVIIITAGFKEVGPEGKKLEEEIVRIARRAGIRIIGPNCLGVIAPAHKLNASFGGDLPAPGAIGYISQSGALLAAILDMANANGIGFSSLVSIGNKADIDELDVIKAFGQQEDTKVIAGYLESITDGDAFVREAEEISDRKPILLMKSGGTAAGAKAASSHTGSLAGGEIAYEAAFKRAGIIRCDSIKQQFDYAQAFANQPLPQGPNVAVITNAGGPGIMAADAIERAGPDLRQAVRGDDAEAGPEAAGRRQRPQPHRRAGRCPGRPLRIRPGRRAGRPERRQRDRAADAAGDDPGDGDRRGRRQDRRAKEDGQADPGLLPGRRQGRRGRAGPAARAASRSTTRRRAPWRPSRSMVDYVRWRTRPKRVVRLFPVNRRKVESIIERHLRQGLREIGEAEAKEILEAYGFATPKGSIATTAEQAAQHRRSSSATRWC